MLRFFIIVLFLFSTAFSSGTEPLNLLNFSSVNSANDMVRQDDTIFIATRGGLAKFQNSSGNFISLHHSHEQFPDISLSALEADGSGLWIGSESGYLYYRPKNRRQRIYDDLFAVESQIQIHKIKNYENYLIIAHSNGVSVFDKKDGKIISTKRNFPDLPNSSVNLIAIKDNTLFLAVKSGIYSGVVRLDNFEKFLGDMRLNDYSPLTNQIPWETELTQEGEIKTIYFNGEGKVSVSSQIVAFGDNFRVQREPVYLDWLEKIDSQGNRKSVNLGSEITFVKLIDGKIAVGTKYDFAYFIDESLDISASKQFVLSGLVNNTAVSKLYLDRDNSLWILPTVDNRDNKYDNSGKWWNAVQREAADGNFFTYNNNTDFFGYMGGSAVFSGISENENGIFLGNSGDHLKYYNKTDDSWGRYIFDLENWTKAPVFVQDNEMYGWLKIDAMITTPDNILWGTIWRDNADGERPLIFAFDPGTNKFRFLLKGMFAELAFPNNFAMTKSGDLLLSFGENNSLWLIDRSKDPFDENIPTIDYLKNTNRAQSTVSALKETAGGNVLIGTTGLLQIYTYDNQTRKSRIVNIDNLPERLTGYTQDMVLEYSEELWSENEDETLMRNVFWIANNGAVERVVIDEYISSLNGNLVRAEYDVTQTDFSLSFANGGINGNASTLVIDKSQNFLLIGGDKGITRIRLPERIIDSSPAKNDFLFPNPFVLNRHITLSIPAPQNSFVDVYTISGKLVKHIDESTAERTSTVDGSHIYKWRIPQNFTPGTYIVAVKSLEGGKIDGKNTKQYKLVVIK